MREVLDQQGEGTAVEEWKSKFFDVCEGPNEAGVVMTAEDVLQSYFTVCVGFLRGKSKISHVSHDFRL